MGLGTEVRGKWGCPMCAGPPSGCVSLLTGWSLSSAPQHHMNTDMVTFTEVSKDPKGMEWLWNPQIVGIYNRLLQRCELNKHTTEAASGALQNITAGDRRVRLGPGTGQSHPAQAASFPLATVGHTSPSLAQTGATTAERPGLNLPRRLDSLVG